MKLIDKYLGSIILGFLSLFKRKTPRFLQENIKKILFIKLIAMGDLLVIAPLVKNIKDNYPNAQIHLLTTPKMQSIVENQGLYDKIFYLRFDKWFLLSFLQQVINLFKQKYSMVFELEFYYRLTTIIAFLIKPKYLIGFQLQKVRSNLYDKEIAFKEELHITEVYLEFAKALDIKVKNQKMLPLKYSQEDKKYVDKLLPNATNSIVIQVGTSKTAVSRRWITASWQELIDKLSVDFPIILAGAFEESEIIKNIVLPESNIANAICKLSIPQMAYLLSVCKLFVGLDTGTTHLASAMGAKILALYGPNLPTRWGPNSKGATIIYNKLDCSPCTRQHLGIVSSCKDNKCMQAIGVAEVLLAGKRAMLDDRFAGTSED